MTIALKKALWLAGGVAVVSALALPKLVPWWRARLGQPALAAAKIRRETGTPVTTVWLQPAALAETLAVIGTLRAEEAVEIQTELAGRITTIALKEGQSVHRGDLLVRLDDTELGATLRRAQARRELAQGKERRLARLLQSGNINQQDYDTARSELSVQEAEVELIAAQLAKTELRAPFDGLVGLRFVSEGSYLPAGARITTLQSVVRLRLDFALPERHAGRLQAGARVDFTVSGDAGRHVGEVYAIEPRVDEATRTVLVRALVDNVGGTLRPGALAEVNLDLHHWPEALLVPAMAIISSEGDKSVYVVENNRAQSRRVETGLRREEQVQVTAGLQAGDYVIVEGVQLVKTGTPVRPTAVE